MCIVNKFGNRHCDEKNIEVAAFMRNTMKLWRTIMVLCLLLLNDLCFMESFEFPSKIIQSLINTDTNIPHSTHRWMFSCNAQLQMKIPFFKSQITNQICPNGEIFSETGEIGQNKWNKLNRSKNQSF